MQTLLVVLVVGMIAVFVMSIVGQFAQGKRRSLDKKEYVIPPALPIYLPRLHLGEAPSRLSLLSPRILSAMPLSLSLLVYPSTCRYFALQ